MNDSSIEVLMASILESDIGDKSAVKAFRSRACDQIRFPFLVFLYLFGAIPLCVFVGFWMDSFLTAMGIHRVWVILCQAVLFYAAFSFFSSGFMRWYARRDMKVLSRWLVTESIRPHTCLLCRYDLRGSNSPSCPECGAALYVLLREQDASALSEHEA